MIRKIIQINEELCDGCGDCEIGCAEGAIKVINGKAKLVKEEYCDGFGDCLSECPTGALNVIERESIEFDEIATKKYLQETKGREAVWQMEEAMKKHKEREISNKIHTGCPGSIIKTIEKNENDFISSKVASNLKNWPIQLHLLPLKAAYYSEADMLLAADCCSYAYGNFHKEFLDGRVLAMCCPKLDHSEPYLNKLASILKENNIKSISVAYMEVPCCIGIVNLAEKAIQLSGKNIPIRKTKIGISGKIIQENISNSF